MNEDSDTIRLGTVEDMAVWSADADLLLVAAVKIAKRAVAIQAAIDESDTPLGSPEMALKKMVAFTQLHEMAVEAGFSA